MYINSLYLIENLRLITKYMLNSKLISSHFKDSIIEISISIFNDELTCND